jgi:predicted ABC-type ATPase
MSETPRIIIIAGPNGAGKSTLAPFLLRDEFGLLEFVNADALAVGLSAFNPEAAAIEAGRIMLKRLRELAAQSASFAFETTLATRSFAVWLRQLGQTGYHISLLYVWLDSPELAIERVQQRVAQGGHNVPETTIRRRYRKGLQNFFALYQSLADEWGVYDNSAEGQPLLIASGKQQASLMILETQLWARFCEAAK